MRAGIVLFVATVLTWGQPLQAQHSQLPLKSASSCLELASPWTGLSSEERHSLAQAAKKSAPECEFQARHLVVLAWLALEEGNDSRALAQAELAVLLEPKSLAIRLEYALILVRLDQADLARSVVQDLLKQSNLPAELRVELRDWVEQGSYPESQVQSAAKVARSLNHQSRFYVGLGGSSNVNNGLSADRIRLTLPSEVIEFPLDKSERAIAGSVMEWGGEGEWLSVRQHSGGNGVGSADWGFAVGLSGMKPFEHSRFETQSIQLVGRLFPVGLKSLGLDRFLGYPLGLEIRTAGARYGNAPLLNSIGTGLVWALPTITYRLVCKPELALSFDSREYSSSPVFNHAAYTLALGAACPRQQGQQLRLGAYVNLNDPYSNRPGGVSRRVGLNTSLLLPMQWGQLMAEFRVDFESDTLSYSQLLENGGRKKVLSSLFGLVAKRPLSANSTLYGRMEFTRHSSNLSLFSSNNAQAIIGFEMLFR
jgi:hypothetical protein